MTPAQIRESDHRTAAAVRQTEDTFGTNAAMFNSSGGYTEGTIVHRNPETGAVVIADKGKFVVGKRIHYQGSTWLDQRHTAHSLGAAIEAAASPALLCLSFVN